MFAAGVHPLDRLARVGERGGRVGLDHDDPARQRPRRLRARQVQDLLEAHGRDQPDARALRLEHRIRGDGRAVEDVPDVADVDPRLLADPADAGEHALRGVGRRRRRLHAEAAAAVAVPVADEEEVGEGAADVDPEPVRHSFLPLSRRPARTCRRGRPVPELPPELAFEPLGDGDQRVEVDAGLDPLAVEQVDEILGADVPGRARRERAAADAADRGVEHRRAGLERRVRVREAGVARVVQVHADWAAERHRLADELRHLARHADADRVGEDDLVGAGVRELLARSRGRGRGRRRPRTGSRTTTPIVTVARIPSSCARATIAPAAASDSSGEAFWLRRLNVSVAAKATCTSSSPVAASRS